MARIYCNSRSRGHLPRTPRSTCGTPAPTIKQQYAGDDDEDHQDCRDDAVATTATVGAIQSASALKPRPSSIALPKSTRTIGYDFKFGTATLDGDTITVDGVTVALIGAPEADMEPMTFDTEITFSGVTELPDGG